jgi:hypothetical protein
LLHDLPETIKDRVLHYAGREAICAYRIACQFGREEQYTEERYVIENLYREPFTYWDWHNTDRNFQEEDERKKLLFNERERGFWAHGKLYTSYPSPARRWETFKNQLSPSDFLFIKRIAVARWMRKEDILFISEHFVNLEALDLSDMETRDGKMPLTHDDGRPNWKELLDIMNTSQNSPSLLSRIKWLGLPNDHHLGDDGDDPFGTILRFCPQLEILSLRTPSGYDSDYWSDLHHTDSEDIHRKICLPILRITKNVPDTVHTIELRQCIDFLPLFIDKLHQLKPTIRRLGIDLGALVQVFPLRPAPKAPAKQVIISDKEIKKNVGNAVKWTTEFGQLPQKTEVLDPSIPNVLTRRSDAVFDAKAKLEKTNTDEKFLDRAYKQEKASFYRDNGGTTVYSQRPRSGPDDPNAIKGPIPPHQNPGAKHCELDDTSHTRTRNAVRVRRTNTLPRMLKKLYNLRNKQPALFALDPEPQNRSTDPINPLALVQLEDELGCGAGARCRDSGFNKDATDIYRYLKGTFNWRPVFDWDWFMVPEKMEDSVDEAYRKMILEDSQYLLRIEQQFRFMHDAGIPVHLLIGRRKQGASSLYWGWPYNSEQKWKHWLDDEFSVGGLDSVAGYVDSLSIFYDLRNPLEQKRLEEIEAIQPLRRPNATCPQEACLWDDTDDGCPFREKRGDVRLDNTQSSGDSDERRPPTDHNRLAPPSAGAPPTGENANNYVSNEGDADDTGQLHELARTAAFTREAVGWQRFWAKYALKFTRLTTLRIRMPAVFEKVSSYRVATLLDRSAGWSMLEYTDERQHVQAAEDVLRTLPGVAAETFNHLPESEVWPGGRFVRRSWVWPKTRAQYDTTVSPEGGNKRVDIISEPMPNWGDQKFTERDYELSELDEREELRKVVDLAAAATQRECDAEAKLPKPDPQLREQGEAEKKRLYHHGVRVVAHEAWTGLLQTEIVKLEKELAKAQQAAAKNADIQGVYPAIPPETQEALKVRLHKEKVKGLQLAIDWLKLRQREICPILGPPGDESEAGNSEDIKAMMGWKNARKMDRSWVLEHWFVNHADKYRYGFWETSEMSKEEAAQGKGVAEATKAKSKGKRKREHTESKGPDVVETGSGTKKARIGKAAGDEEVRVGTATVLVEPTLETAKGLEQERQQEQVPESEQIPGSGPQTQVTEPKTQEKRKRGKKEDTKEPAQELSTKQAKTVEPADDVTIETQKVEVQRIEVATLEGEQTVITEHTEAHKPVLEHEAVKQSVPRPGPELPDPTPEAGLKTDALSRYSLPPLLSPLPPLTVEEETDASFGPSPSPPTGPAIEISPSQPADQEQIPEPDSPSKSESPRKGSVKIPATVKTGSKRKRTPPTVATPVAEDDHDASRGEGEVGTGDGAEANEDKGAALSVDTEDITLQPPPTKKPRGEKSSAAKSETSTSSTKKSATPKGGREGGKQKAASLAPPDSPVARRTRSQMKKRESSSS